MEWLGTVAIWIGVGLGLAVALVIAIRLFAQPDESGSSGGGGMFGGLDEAFNPAQHNANLERERQRLAPIESPVPGDRMWESDALKVEYSVDGTPTSIVLPPRSDKSDVDLVSPRSTDPMSASSTPSERSVLGGSGSAERGGDISVLGGRGSAERGGDISVPDERA